MMETLTNNPALWLVIVGVVINLFGLTANNSNLKTLGCLIAVGAFLGILVTKFFFL